MTRRRLLRLPLTIALLTTTGLSACSDPSPTHEPDEVDQARVDALVADPWPGLDSMTLTRHAPGTNNRYLPTEGTVYREGVTARTEVVVLREEVDRASESGWWVYYAQCSRGPATPHGLGGGPGVYLARELPDGSLAQAALHGEFPDSITIDVTAANHDMVQPEAPAEVELDSLSCFSPGGAGVASVGDPVELTKDW